VRTRYGEIDLVALQQETDLPECPEAVEHPYSVVVFIEVKTRLSTSFGLPEESVTYKKKKHLLHAAEAYMQDHPELPPGWRIDVIAIQGKTDAAPCETIHFENVVN
jgi:putative endonuclease